MTNPQIHAIAYHHPLRLASCLNPSCPWRRQAPHRLFPSGAKDRFFAYVLGLFNEFHGKKDAGPKYRPPRPTQLPTVTPDGWMCERCKIPMLEVEKRDTSDSDISLFECNACWARAEVLLRDYRYSVMEGVLWSETGSVV